MEEVETEIMKEVKIHKGRIENPESSKAILQKQIEELEKLATKNQDQNEALEKYGRRLCLRIEGVPVEKREACEGVLKKLLQCARKLT